MARRRTRELFDQFDGGPKTTTSSVRLSFDEKLAVRVAALGCRMPVYRYLHGIIMPTVYRDADSVMHGLKQSTRGRKRAV